MNPKPGRGLFTLLRYLFNEIIMRHYKPIKIVLADDHEIFRDGFRVMLKKQNSIQLIGEAANGEQLVELAESLKPDVIITDIKMPVLDGIEATRYILNKHPGIQVIGLTMFDDDNLIIDMLEAGAKGYLLKSAHKKEIIDAITTVHNNETYYCKSTSGKLVRMIAQSRFDPYTIFEKPVFNEKELQIIRYICEEISNREIAERMCLSVRTIEGYRDKIQEKIKAKNIVGIVIYAIKTGIYKI